MRIRWFLALCCFIATPVFAQTPTATVRGGQVFVTWAEDGSTSYAVKRDGVTIATVAADSGTDLYTGQRFTVVSSGQGLFVDTPHVAGSHTYTVNNSSGTTVSVDPTLGILPVLVQDAHTCNGINTCYSYIEWEDLATFPTAIMGGQHRRFDVVITSGAPLTDRPLFLDLHSAPQYGYFEPNTFIDNAWNGVYVFPVDFSYNYGPDPYSGQWQPSTAWFGYLVGTTPTKATEDRVIRYTQWVIAQQQFKVDPTRVYVKGASMGGGGAMKIGFHYPNLFAGIASSIAWVAYYDWGPNWNGMPGHTVSGTSILFDTYEDGQAWVEAGNAVPPITLTFRQDDNIIPQQHYGSFMSALDDHHVGYVATWQGGGHQTYWHDAAQSDDITRYRKNEAYLSFSGMSSNDAYAVNGSNGQRNAVPDYSSSLHSFGAGTAMVDTPTRFAVTVRGSSAATGFATIHNAQQFTPAAGSTVHWQQGTWNGDVTVNQDGTITVPVGVGTDASVLELGQTSQQFPVITSQNIPDFAAFPTKTAVVDGAWNTANTWNPSGVPSASDVVRIPAGKTVTLSSGSAVAKALGVYGTFRQTNAQLTVTTMLVYVGGYWELGTEAAPTGGTVVIRNTPIDPATDPQHWGTGIIDAGGKIVAVGQPKTTFLAVNGDVAPGSASIPLEAAPSGWLAGDKLILPATDQWYLDAGPYSATWEEVVLNTVSGSNVTTSARTFNHQRPRKQDGSIADRFHVGNLTRSIVVRSEDPQGTRGHFVAVDRSDVTLRYVEFEDFGRTTAEPLDVQTNAIGRYTVHLHHMEGPVTPQANGKQFTLVGLAINHSRKWGIDVHDADWGLVQDNVIYDAEGSSIMTEDGTETNNVFDHNFMVVALGPGYGGFGSIDDWATGGSEREDAARNPNTGDRGWGGECFWARGMQNTFTNNVCANANAFGVYIYPTNLGVISIPDFQGADHMHRHNVDSITIPLGKTENNTIYASANGWSIWNVCTFGISTVYNCAPSTLKDSTLWGIGRHGIYFYGINNFTVDGYKQYGDLSPWSWSPYVFNHCIWFGDYISPNTTLNNVSCEGLRTGIVAPFKPGDTADIYGNAGTPFVISNSFLANEWNISVSSMYAVGGGDGSLSQRHTFINNVRYGPMNTSNFPGGFGQCNICMSMALNNPNVNIMQLDEVTVNGYNGTNENFRVFYNEQAPNFVVPESSTGVTGAPVPGLTNAQLWSQYDVAYAGAVASCTTTRADIQGIVCSSGTGQTPQPPGTAVISPNED
jgi:dienelactone hydrolase